MPKTNVLKGNAGTTLIELMIAVAVFSGSMVMLSGSVITYTSHNLVSEKKASATAFGNSVIEDIRGLDINGIINYEIPVDNPDTGTVFIPGMGDAWVVAWAIVPDPEGQYEQWYMLGQSGFPPPSTLPNPIEIKVEAYEAAHASDGEQYGTPLNFSVSSLISH